MKQNWYEIPGAQNDVVVSSRVRLARNLNGYPFAARLTEEKERDLCARIAAVYPQTDGWQHVDMVILSAGEKASLAEKHVISPEFAEKKTPGILLSKNSIHSMVSEEDHLRIQSIYPGLALEAAYTDAAFADALLDAREDVAYSEKFGYLTHCPTNLGTGMRASVMLFLPAYTMAGGIGALSAQLSKIGLTIRGLFGEGSTAQGCLYQISNQVTLGITEEETIRKLESVVAQITAKERELRERQDRTSLEDKAWRSLGTLLYARRMSTKEMLGHYTMIRLGAAMKLLDTVNCTMTDILRIETMPNTLAQSMEAERRGEVERDIKRAQRCREILTPQSV